MKGCTKCDYFGDLSGFYKCSANKDGRMNICSRCHRNYMAAKRDENRKPQQRRILSEQEPEVIRLYTVTGKSMERIGKIYGASRSTVKAVLKKHGVPRRRPITPCKTKPLKKMKPLSIQFLQRPLIGAMQ